MALVAIATSAQDFHLRRPCIHGSGSYGATRAELPVPNTQWSPHRTYRQAVILVQFADFPFSMADPNTYYTHLLNLSSSNTRGGAGCAADYFRDQSNGQFNVQFDVYGPVKVSQKAQITSGGENYSVVATREATRKAVDSLDVDFRPYDWNGDGEVDQVIYIVSGYAGNNGKEGYQGYTWPNTDWFRPSTVKVGDDLYVNQYSVSAEKTVDEIPCGIGTLIHEYSHCLGLPDIYPVSGSVFSMVDEWDLMDGGNFTANGWCPPNYSALEKNLLGWLSIDTISEPCQIRDLKPVADGGKAYVMPKQGNEFYLLENRQQSGWDRGLPGKGLLIYRVDYDASSWRYNLVNTSSKTRYELIHADGLDYDAWRAYLKANNLSLYADEENGMNNRVFSHSAYPLITDTLQITECTSTPFPLLNIQMSDEGLISFTVDNGTDIKSPLGSAAWHGQETSNLQSQTFFDLSGRKLNGNPTRKGVYIQNKRKIIVR